MVVDFCVGIRMCGFVLNFVVFGNGIGCGMGYVLVG